MSLRTWIKGSSEFLTATVTCNVQLATQPVTISFDRITWLDAEWLGTPGLVRKCRVLANDVNLPASDKPLPVWIRVVDISESPITKAGTLIFE